MDWDVRRFAEIDSTNTWLLGQARAGAAAGLVAIADRQTAGRGRLDRQWEAPAGSSLLTSVLLRPQLPPARLHLTTAAVGLAAAAAVERVAGFRPALKWPNDLVVDDLKLAGILAEVDLPAVVVGIGLNVNWRADQLLPTATACNVIAGRRIDRDLLLDAFLNELSSFIDNLAGAASAYRHACATIGRLVRVDLADESFSGRATDVDDDGHLLVDVGSCVRTVTAGDVVHIRPTG